MEPTSKRESGALVCAPAAVICLSVSETQDFTKKKKKKKAKDTKCLSRITQTYKVTFTSQICCTGAIGCICPFALSCYTATKYGENCCLGCLPGGMAAIRTHMRLTYGIQVSNKVILVCVEGGRFEGNEEGFILSHLAKQSCSGISSLF